MYGMINAKQPGPSTELALQSWMNEVRLVFFE
jgi:hypothetical protein